ncbi:excinuclease ABC subunit UvrC [Meiothermus taiwanensis]|jgi:excinuclease ABC subunit C|uniref:UvrABC system protein C n=2 Tax=Meiothermus taiwanensis TaxID=172827 RepID=A0A399DTT7_9DEIN|nr:excinuclease ABC subunit UvrC [Meiothermus taiwanensis]AWR87250.1 excinuclease ABC, C subunit [Meiothermus taiwanensis WR-220]KIQ53531.1 excinuclease ABC subunit C [Meiothermus taiwanensis]KZK16886.1 excinuclease ABC subunit C [Meiothermus taiwanensis]RIH74853.1 UvrABC system protein C [Meiothermus taiwanensis]
MRLEDLPPLPETPGVYLWKTGEHIIYVGKAKNLKARVTSYFHAEGKGLRICQEATHLDFIVVRDEVEALLLEANLIKHHRPHYNVLMKDDKHYPFLKLTQEEWPMLMVVRRVQDDGARYWGPFPEASVVRRIKRLVDRFFPLRKNSGYPFKKRRYPCLNHAMGRCLAPCVGQADPAQYQMAVQQVENLLDGKIEALYESLEQQMRQAARNQDFERAAEIRDQISAVKSFFGTDQQAYDPELGDLDFLGFARAGDYALIQHYQVRGGQMLGRISRFVEGVKEASDAELLEAFLRDYYLEATPLPPLVLLPFELEAQEAFSAFLSSKGRKVEVRVPQRGEKTRLIELAQHNAQTALQTELKLLERKGDHPGLKGLMEVLGLTRRPYRIEGYDISNLLGESVVGSITVFEGGRPKKAEYRRIKIRGLKGQPDDFFSMEQTILRRFTGSLAEQMPIPDLILIDGGLGQVRAAQKALQQAGLEIPLVGLAKREETLVLPDGRTIALPLSHPALQLLIYQRDETHRNGLEFHRKLRNQKALKSIFDDIKGIGPARKLALMNHFSTLEELKAMSVEELAKLPGLDKRSAQAVLKALNATTSSQSTSA